MKQCFCCNPRQTYKGLKKLLWFGGGIMNVSLNKRQHYLTGLSNAMEGKLQSKQLNSNPEAQVHL